MKDLYQFSNVLFVSIEENNKRVPINLDLCHTDNPLDFPLDLIENINFSDVSSSTLLAHHKTSQKYIVSKLTNSNSCVFAIVPHFIKDEASEQQIENAYREGVAENAVSILHNIGNILTTIIGKMSNDNMLADMTLLRSVLAKLAATFSKFQTHDEFIQFVTTDPKAKAIPKLICELAKCSDSTSSVVQDTFSSVKQKCSDIADVIAAQQRYANFKDKGASEISARKIVGDCLIMHKERIGKREINVEVEEFPIVNIYMEKVGFAQTVSNAIMNAIEAIDDRFSKDPSYINKSIKIKAKEQDQFLIIEFTDNGIGISPETLNKLFQFGFSTKNRSSGFGLHNCANFMNSNKGKMEITSEGIGKGAKTILYCPMTTSASMKEIA